jgi:deazaflavin-dependent oxidoreductase (nitroreductase family)
MSDKDDRIARNQAIIDEFRANDGKVGGDFAGAPLLLLTTTGAKSGQQRTSPVVYTTDGDRLVVIASYAGRPTNPLWFTNLVANPEVTVEIPGETFAARAVVAGVDDRDRLYAAQAAQMPAFAEYQAKTTRTIPVVTLERMT